MFMGSTERLARWVASLDARIQEAEAELARPLCSPWLRCACGVFQTARLGLVMRDGMRVVAAGMAQVRCEAYAGNLPACAQAGRASAAAARVVAHAGIMALRSMSVAGMSILSTLLAQENRK